MESVRILKVAAQPVPRARHKYKFQSKISLSGNWLQDAGFAIGDFISVVVTDNYIQIVKEQTNELKKEVGNV